MCETFDFILVRRRITVEPTESEDVHVCLFCCLLKLQLHVETSNESESSNKTDLFILIILLIYFIWKRTVYNI